MMRRAWMSAVLVVAVAACIAEDRKAIYACEADGSCPNGGFCSPAHLCVFEGLSTADAGVDGGSGDGGLDGGADASVQTYDASVAWELSLGPQNNKSGPFEAQPTVTPDGLELCFARAPGAGDIRFDIFCAARNSVNEPFGAGIAQTAVNNPSNTEFSPALSRDGGELFYVGVDVDKQRLFRATFNPGTGQFSDGNLVSVSGSLSNWHGGPALAPDEKSLLLVIHPGNYALADLYRVPRTGPGTFGTPVALTTLNSPDIDIDPYEAEDGTVYFASNRDAGIDAGAGYHVWVALPVGDGGYFTPTLFPRPLVGINQGSPQLTPEGGLLYSAEDPQSGDVNIHYLRPQ